MTFIGVILYWALTVYFYVLFGRFFLDIAVSVNPSWRPKGPVLVLAEIVMTLTDPPLRFLRRFIKPIRLGAISLDLSWTALLLAVSFATGLAARLAVTGL